MFGANQFVNVETIVLLTAADTRFGGQGARFSYTLTMHDGNVAAGQQLTIQANGLRANEVLTLDASAETNGSYRLYGGAGADTIAGGAGNDEIWGRLGADILRGGAGADVFAYLAVGDSTVAARDTIMDFARGDLIDLHRAGLSSFVGTGAFTGAGQVRVEQQGNNWLVQCDLDGDGAADLSILVEAGAGYAWAVTDFRLAAAPVADVPMIIA